MISMWKRVVAGVVASVAAVTLTSASTGPALATGPAAPAGVPGLAAADPTQDGRDLFTGAYFLVGPEADAVAEATKAPADAVEANQSADAVAYVEEVVAYISEREPGFFAEFSGMLRSGNPFEVQHAIDQGRQLIAEAAEALGATVTMPGSYDPAASWFIVVVAVTVAATASAAASFNVVVLVQEFAFGSAPAGGDLEQEQAIAILTEAFAA